MRYYKIKVENFYGERIASKINGKFIPNVEVYFNKIRKKQIVFDAPIFDYFVLESFDEQKYWEWALFDVHLGMGEYPGNSNWYVSDKFKKLIDCFKIAPKHFFYETKLLYKKNKLKYWIFQFPINPLQNYNYEKSEYFLDGKRITGVNNADEYDEYDYRIWKETKKKIIWKNIVLIEDFDLIQTMQNDLIVSERLKKAMEESEITGFDFSELDYEVVIDSYSR